MEEMNCGRENELIGFLYGELDSTEKPVFQRHLQTCEGCKSQLASFTDLRESVVAWRDESLGVLTSPVRQFVTINHSKPLALAALREFFNLAPLWMKGTVAFATLLFGVFAVLAIARFNQTAPVNSIASINNPASTQELQKEVERRVKEELHRRSALQPQPSIAIAEKPSRPSASRRPNVRATRAAQHSSLVTARPLSKLERQELAADLRLTNDQTDTDLVLIGDRINQQE